MERTIDGIDYIAKSEVLRIIDEEIADAEQMRTNPDLDEDFQYGWLCSQRGLETLRRRIANPEER